MEMSEQKNFDLKLPMVIEGHLTCVSATGLGANSSKLFSIRLEWLDCEKSPSLAEIWPIYSTLVILYEGLVIDIHPESRNETMLSNFLGCNLKPVTKIDVIQFNLISPISEDLAKKLILRFLTLLFCKV